MEIKILLMLVLCVAIATMSHLGERQNRRQIKAAGGEPVAG